MATLYEIMTILDPDETDDGVNAIIGGFRQAIANAGGEVLAVDVWGRRKLAYPIKKRQEGIYVLMHAEGAANLPQEFRAHTRIRESVLRELVLKLEDAHEQVVREQLATKGPEDPALAAAQIAAAEQRAANKRAALTATVSEAAAEEETAGQEAAAQAAPATEPDQAAGEPEQAAADSSDDEAAADDAGEPGKEE